jgi:hypothetical protein
MRLRILNIAAHSFYHEEALEADAAQEAFAFLTLLGEPEDRVALRFLLGFGFGSTSWLAGQYAKLRAYCEETGVSPKEALDKQVAGVIAIPGIGKLHARYQMIVSRLGELWDRVGEELVNVLFLEDSDDTKLLRDSVMSIVTDEMKAEAMVERLRNLLTLLRPKGCRFEPYPRSQTSNLGPTAAQRFDQLDRSYHLLRSKIHLGLLVAQQRGFHFTRRV